ncbi:hypothetical protein XENOCAPTIV_005276, partial [Xenoophorus captivus]
FLSQNSVEMPQTNKSVSGGSVPGQLDVPEQGEPPSPQDVRLTAGEGAVDKEEQGDPEIIKSPSDPKKYRYIELSNGLRALLISDFSGADGHSKDQREQGGADGMDGEDEVHCDEGCEEEEEIDEEEDQDRDLIELDIEETMKKRKTSEKQVGQKKMQVVVVV